MSKLFIVRHGQASFDSDDYDQLSAIGQAQSLALGKHWASLGLQFDRVYVGPRKRHRQTAAWVAEAYRSQGLTWPEPEQMPELDEHHGYPVMEHVLPDLRRQNPQINALYIAARESGEVQRETVLRLLQAVMLLWAREEIKADGFEPWADFRARVRQGVAKIRAANGRGSRIAAFTSTGPVAVVAGEALSLADEPTLKLSWVVRNATYSEFLFSGDHFSLSTFNAASHFYEPDLWTLV